MDAVEQILDRMNEGVLVAEDVPGRPPGAGVRVSAFGDVDRPEALHPLLVFRQEDVQFVQPLQVEPDRTLFAVDFERVVVAPPRRQPRRLERAGRAAAEAGEEGRRIVDRHRPHLLSGHRFEAGAAAADRFDRPLLDEGVERADDLGDRADEVEGEIGDVRRDVAERAGAGDLAPQPPDERKIRVVDPVLQIDRPPVPDLPDRPRFDQLLGEGDGRHAPVVEIDHRHNAGVVGGDEHLPRFVERVGERLFAENVLAGRQRRQHDLLVRIARRRDIDQPDVGPGNQLVIVGFVPFPAELFGRFLDAGFVPPANGDHPRLRLDVEKVRHLPVRIRMRPPHEFVANEANADFAHWSPPVRVEKSSKSRSYGARIVGGSIEADDEGTKEPADLIGPLQQALDIVVA